jgi:hypothetical protein
MAFNEQDRDELFDVGKKVLIPDAAFADIENPTDDEVLEWFQDPNHLPVDRRDRSVAVFNKGTTGVGNGMSHDFMWILFDDGAGGVDIERMPAASTSWITAEPFTINVNSGTGDDSKDVSEYVSGDTVETFAKSLDIIKAKNAPTFQVNFQTYADLSDSYGIYGKNLTFNLSANFEIGASILFTDSVVTWSGSGSNLFAIASRLSYYNCKVNYTSLLLDIHSDQLFDSSMCTIYGSAWTQSVDAAFQIAGVCEFVFSGENEIGPTLSMDGLAVFESPNGGALTIKVLDDSHMTIDLGTYDYKLIANTEKCLSDVYLLGNGAIVHPELPISVGTRFWKSPLPVHMDNGAARTAGLKNGYMYLSPQNEVKMVGDAGILQIHTFRFFVGFQGNYGAAAVGDAITPIGILAGEYVPIIVPTRYQFADSSVMGFKLTLTGAYFLGVRTVMSIPSSNFSFIDNIISDTESVTAVMYAGAPIDIDGDHHPGCHITIDYVIF